MSADSTGTVLTGTDDTRWLTDYYAAWDSADVEAILAWFDPEVEFEDVPSGHIAKGLDAARAFVEFSIKKVPGASYEVVSCLSSATEFAVEWVMHPVGLRGSPFGKLHDGKIVLNRDYWNAGKAS